MHHTLFVTIAIACLSTALAEPSNYFYRISPADAPLKEAPVLYAPRPDYPVDARRRHLTGGGLLALTFGETAALSESKSSRVSAIAFLIRPPSRLSGNGGFVQGAFLWCVCLYDIRLALSHMTPLVATSREITATVFR